ncbi:MAG: T9SS type A sorting domain-containing protein [Algibacter sp.]|uniref:T9SS type A sorting domain-containing protein n=1 Tax=Algibacter sp. TaxID=1872428 RepID=UPI00260B4372|nr:T9SS type A sorting domain-containing protein [Algibacter sp.]MDG1728257.1 T9SS type A sorting domain-containing protein [Algibacter sp.]MDG2178215.1 T9SS type A sorting domain-containing protein [Algibacter sp.]
MKKAYILFLFAILALFTSQNMGAQNYAKNPTTHQNIEGLSIYPNPANSQRPIINIASKHNLIKHIEIFDVLGKQVFATIISNKELNISNLRKGVYILKITENNISASRKLVIK